MSAPTKCEQCGATGTFAIQVPCIMKCGGMMYYDHGRAVAPAGAPPELNDAAVDAASQEYLRVFATHREALVAAIRVYARAAGGAP